MLPAIAVLISRLPLKADPAVLLSKGMGLKAGNKPMASYTRRPGERQGHNWYIPNVLRSSEPACRRQVPARRIRRKLLEDLRPRPAGNRRRRPRGTVAVWQEVRTAPALRRARRRR
jgi:hypothetical protein